MNFNKFRKEWLLLLVFIIIFIAIRSINFAEHLNFSFDQGWGASKILELWKNKKITLVGPGSSLIANNKPVLQGSIIYYFNLLFFLLGDFDPIKSSYFFMLFCALAIIPLYFGVKMLFNKKAALLTVVFFALFYLYVDFTRFFFGPNFQLSLLPLLIFFMGIYQKTKKSIYLFFVYFLNGILLQFHYQFIIVIIVLSIYYLVKSKKKQAVLFLMTAGFAIGFSPMIIFELKNKFYNTKVFFEYLQAPKKTNFALHPHRYLSISLMFFVLVFGVIKNKISGKLILLGFLTFFLIDLFLYLPKPKHGFGMADSWNYSMEKKTYQIIKKQGTANFNIVNRAYDNLAVVIKYLIRKDNYLSADKQLLISYDDYYNNDFLYVISKNPNIFNDPAYEINTFKPNKLIRKWKLNEVYNLYLFERIKNTDRKKS